MILGKPQRSTSRRLELLLPLDEGGGASERTRCLLLCPEITSRGLDREWRVVTRISSLLGNIGQLASPGIKLALHGVLSVSCSLITSISFRFPLEGISANFRFITIYLPRILWEHENNGPVVIMDQYLGVIDPSHLYVPCKNDRVRDSSLLQSRSSAACIYHSFVENT
jgi:hypothetical protein